MSCFLTVFLSLLLFQMGHVSYVQSVGITVFLDYMYIKIFICLCVLHMNSFMNACALLHMNSFMNVCALINI